MLCAKQKTVCPCLLSLGTSARRPAPIYRHRTPSVPKLERLPPVFGSMLCTEHEIACPVFWNFSKASRAGFPGIERQARPISCIRSSLSSAQHATVFCGENFCKSFPRAPFKNLKQGVRQRPELGGQSSVRSYPGNFARKPFAKVFPARLSKSARKGGQGKAVVRLKRAGNTAGGRRQAAGGRRQAAGGRRQAAGHGARDIKKQPRAAQMPFAVDGTEVYQLNTHLGAGIELGWDRCMIPTVFCLLEKCSTGKNPGMPFPVICREVHPQIELT